MTAQTPCYIEIYKNSSLIFTYSDNITDSSYNVSYNTGDTFYFKVVLSCNAGDSSATLILKNSGNPIFTFQWSVQLD